MNQIIEKQIIAKKTHEKKRRNSILIPSRDDLNNDKFIDYDKRDEEINFNVKNKNNIYVDNH